MGGVQDGPREAKGKSQWTHRMSPKDGKAPGEPRGTWGGPREAQGSSGRSDEPQGGRRGAQGDQQKPKEGFGEAQRGPGDAWGKSGRSRGCPERSS